MNKYLLLTAAAALATTGANAGNFKHSFVFSGYCDGGNVYTSGSTVWAWQHTNNNCASGESTGQGLVGKVAAEGRKSANMSDNYFGNYKSLALNYNLPAKLKNGGRWTLYIEFSGTSSFLGNSGSIQITAGAHKGSKSTLAGVKSLLAAHKAAKHQG
jgi:hypothetical protein